MWTIRWNGTNGESRDCSIDEEFVRESLIFICSTGARLDEIEVFGPLGRVRAWDLIPR